MNETKATIFTSNHLIDTSKVSLRWPNIGRVRIFFSDGGGVGVAGQERTRMLLGGECYMVFF